MSSNSLQEAPAVELLRYYCTDAQAEDHEALSDFVKRLEGYVLAVEFAGLRLRDDPGLQVRELASEYKASADVMDLEGPTLDKPSVTIRRLLRNSYHRLDAPERMVLASLAAVPSSEYSQETVHFFAMAQSLGGVRRSLEPVREHLELSESFVIQGRRPDLFGGRRCGRARIAEAMTEVGCAIRAI